MEQCSIKNCRKKVHESCKTCEVHMPILCSKEECKNPADLPLQYFCLDHKKKVLKCENKKCQIKGKDRILYNGKCINHGGRDQCGFFNITECSKKRCETNSNNFGVCSKHGKELGITKKCSVYGCKNTFRINKDKKYCSKHLEMETKTVEIDKKKKETKKRTAETITEKNSNKKQKTEKIPLFEEIKVYSSRINPLDLSFNGEKYDTIYKKTSKEALDIFLENELGEKLDEEMENDAINFLARFGRSETRYKELIKNKDEFYNDRGKRKSKSKRKSKFKKI